MRSERNAPKNVEPTVGLSFTTMLQHTGRFCQGFISKEQCDNTGPYSPDLAPPDLYPLPRLKSALKGRRCCYHTGIIKNAVEEPKRRARNGFQESFQQLYSSCQKRIVAQGEHFEGNVG